MILLAHTQHCRLAWIQIKVIQVVSAGESLGLAVASKIFAKYVLNQKLPLLFHYHNPVIKHTVSYLITGEKTMSIYSLGYHTFRSPETQNLCLPFNNC